MSASAKYLVGENDVVVGFLFIYFCMVYTEEEIIVFSLSFPYGIDGS